MTLFFLGLDSAFSMLEAITTVICDAEIGGVPVRKLVCPAPVPCLLLTPSIPAGEVRGSVVMLSCCSSQVYCSSLSLSVGSCAAKHTRTHRHPDAHAHTHSLLSFSRPYDRPGTLRLWRQDRRRMCASPPKDMPGPSRHLPGMTAWWVHSLHLWSPLLVSTWQVLGDSCNLADGSSGWVPRS